MSDNTITLQRRHFEMIADVISSVDIPAEHKQKVIKAFSRRLSSTNPNFMYEKFEQRANESQTVVGR